MNISEKEKDKMYEIYMICYKEMCEEIDEMTKPFRVEFTDEDTGYYQSGYCQTCDICKGWYVGSVNDIGYSQHAKTRDHLMCAIQANKHLLEWRAFEYINKLKSKK
jgi:hypothetical protein